MGSSIDKSENAREIGFSANIKNAGTAISMQDVNGTAITLYNKRIKDDFIVKA